MGSEHEPHKRCALCGKIVEREKPCPYNYMGMATCDQCCENCFNSEPFPCREHDLREETRKEGNDNEV